MRDAFFLPMLLLLATAPAQGPHQWVVPSRAVLAPAGAQLVRVVGAEARVRIVDRAATTTLQIELHNPAAVQQEAVLLLPVPDGAAVSSFAFEGAAATPTARVLPRDEARRLYDERGLRDEILRLSTRFGVLGEYTAFLATAGSDLGNWHALTTACQNELSGRAIVTRSGAAAVNQGSNPWAQKTQDRANYRNTWLDPNMRPVETTAIQQICDRAFFRRGDRWIDGSSVVNKRLDADERVVFGSDRYEALRQRLEAEGRGGVLSLRGELLLEVDGKNVLIEAPLPSQSFPVK